MPPTPSYSHYQHTSKYSISRLTRLMGLCCLVVLCLGASSIDHPLVKRNAEPVGVQLVGHGEPPHYAYLPEQPRIRHQLNSGAADNATLCIQDDDPFTVPGYAIAAPCPLCLGRANWLAAQPVYATTHRAHPARAPPYMWAV